MMNSDQDNDDLLAHIDRMLGPNREALFDDDWPLDKLGVDPYTGKENEDECYEDYELDDPTEELNFEE